MVLLRFFLAFATGYHSLTACVRAIQKSTSGQLWEVLRFRGYSSTNLLAIPELPRRATQRPHNMKHDTIKHDGAAVSNLNINDEQYRADDCPKRFGNTVWTFRNALWYVSERISRSIIHIISYYYRIFNNHFRYTLRIRTENRVYELTKIAIETKSVLRNDKDDNIWCNRSGFCEYVSKYFDRQAINSYEKEKE